MKNELKQQWQQGDELQNLKNKNIMDLIKNSSNGPVAALKKSFKRQMTVMVIVPMAIIVTNLPNIDKTLTSALFWFYILFCIGVIIFARLNFTVVKKMERMDGKVKSNLEQQIVILETRIRQNIIGIRIALLFFIVLTEILPYFQNFRMLNKWHSLSPFVRYGAYAALFLVQYFVSRAKSYRKFGQHISNLKELVKQME